MKRNRLSVLGLALLVIIFAGCEAITNPVGNEATMSPPVGNVATTKAEAMGIIHDLGKHLGPEYAIRNIPDIRDVPGVSGDYYEGYIENFDCSDEQFMTYEIWRRKVDSSAGPSTPYYTHITEIYHHEVIGRGRLEFKHVYGVKLINSKSLLKNSSLASLTLYDSNNKKLMTFLYTAGRDDSTYFHRLEYLVSAFNALCPNLKPGEAR